MCCTLFEKRSSCKEVCAEKPHDAVLRLLMCYISGMEKCMCIDFFAAVRYN